MNPLRRLIASVRVRKTIRLYNRFYAKIEINTSLVVSAYFPQVILILAKIGFVSIALYTVPTSDWILVVR